MATNSTQIKISLMDLQKKLRELVQTRFGFAYMKLTVFYVLIIMTISITFSAVVYNTSTAELTRGLGRQNGIFRDIQLDDSTIGMMFPNIDTLRQNQVNESSGRLKNDLIFLNILILVISSIGSYLFARRTLEPIEKAMDTQNRFTADASHELRTPLTAMRTEIEVALRDDKISATEARQLLQSNLEEINKLESLTGALLKLARHQSRDDKNFSIICLKEIITEAYEKIELMAEKKSISFETNLDHCSSRINLKLKDAKRVPIVNSNIEGDRQSLVELFTILFDNAIKYSPNKSKIKVLVKNEGHKTVVSVSDHGIGIKSSDLPYIFNRFYRADLSRSKEKIDGYGLGLSIAKNIVEFNEGKITVKSKPGVGTQFFVTLPSA